MHKLRTPCIVNFLACVDQALRERMRREASLLKKFQPAPALESDPVRQGER
jgi:hypothetical protein